MQSQVSISLYATHSRLTRARLKPAKRSHGYPKRRLNIATVTALALSVGLSAGLALLPSARAATLTNASFDVSRELFTALNKPFIAQWDQQHPNDPLTIKQSHAGSSSQARSIVQGLDADVVTFNQTSDIDVIAKAGLIAPNWQSRLPNNSSPFYSTMAFLVRKGNPHHIHNWQDLAQPGLKLVFPNPKTSGNGRYAYLAAWAAAQRQDGNDESKTRAFMHRFLANAAVLDSGGRGATTSFVERGIGDVLISFESEVASLKQQYAGQGLEVVVPPVDIRANMPVAWVDANVKRNHSGALAKAYLNYLYSPAAQRIIAEHDYRVRNPAIARAQSKRFPATRLLDINQVLGSWDTILSTHFASGGVLDQLQRP